MPLDFPNSPSLNQVFYSISGLQWVWDGIKWLAGASFVSAGSSSEVMIIVTSSVTLPNGFTGFVRVENSTNAPMTVWLPASPNSALEITVKDCLGNAALYPITVAGNGSNIEATSSLVIPYNFGWVDLVYVGNKWAQT